jgi:hypothetical protein
VDELARELLPAEINSVINRITIESWEKNNRKGTTQNDAGGLASSRKKVNFRQGSVGDTADLQAVVETMSSWLEMDSLFLRMLRMMIQEDGLHTETVLSHLLRDLLQSAIRILHQDIHRAQILLPDSAGHT